MLAASPLSCASSANGALDRDAFTVNGQTIWKMSPKRHVGIAK